MADRQRAAGRAPAGPAPALPDELPAPLRAWLRPVGPLLETARATAGTPAGELTMPEILAWACLGIYAIASGYAAGRIAGNLAAAALRGPGRR